jgi:hypothetical protein
VVEGGGVSGGADGSVGSSLGRKAIRMCDSQRRRVRAGAVASNAACLTGGCASAEAAAAPEAVRAHPLASGGEMGV